MSLFQESIIRKHLGYLNQEVVEQAYLRFKEVYSANKITNIKVAKEEQMNTKKRGFHRGDENQIIYEFEYRE